MIAMIREPEWDEEASDGSWEQGGMERIRHHSRGEFPVRSHAAQMRAKKRSLATPAAKRKARRFHGANYRGSHRHWMLSN